MNAIPMCARKQTVRLKKWLSQTVRKKKRLTKIFFKAEDRSVSPGEVLLSTVHIWPSVQDRDGHDRVTGEEWIVKKVGAYLPGAYEEVCDVVEAYVLTEKVILFLLNCCQAKLHCSKVWLIHGHLPSYQNVLPHSQWFRRMLSLKELLKASWENKLSFCLQIIVLAGGENLRRT